MILPARPRTHTRKQPTPLENETTPPEKTTHPAINSNAPPPKQNNPAGKRTSLRGKRKPPPSLRTTGTRKSGGYLLSHLRSTIGAAGLNFSVRDGKRWNPGTIAT